MSGETHLSAPQKPKSCSESDRTLGRLGNHLAQPVTSTRWAFNGGLQCLQIESRVWFYFEPNLLGDPVGAQSISIDPFHLAQCRPHFGRAGESCHTFNSGYISIKTTRWPFRSPFATPREHCCQAQKYGYSQNSHRSPSRSVRNNLPFHFSF